MQNRIGEYISQLFTVLQKFLVIIGLACEKRRSLGAPKKKKS